MTPLEAMRKIVDEMHGSSQIADWATRLQAELDRMKAADVKLSDTKELNDLLLKPDPAFTAWRNTILETYWARYDLSAVKLGWSAAMHAHPPADAGKESKE